MKLHYSKIFSFLWLLFLISACDDLDVLNYEIKIKPDKEVNDDKKVEYSEIIIGDQIWMSRNLNLGIMIDPSQPASNNNIIEKYCYNNDTSLCSIYGGLYTWDEIMKYGSIEGSQGICPAGWHIPTQDEWVTLIRFLGGNRYAGGSLKEIGTDHWSSPNLIMEPMTEFKALPSGFYDPYGEGSFVGLAYQTFFWTSTKNPEISFSVLLQNEETSTTILGSPRDAGFSLRCIKN